MLYCLFQCTLFALNDPHPTTVYRSCGAPIVVRRAIYKKRPSGELLTRYRCCENTGDEGRGVVVSNKSGE